MSTETRIVTTGEKVTVVSVSHGWTTVKLESGDIKKVRNSALNTTPSVESKVLPMETQARNLPPARPAAPAHFVGDKSPGRAAKIGDTQFKLDRYFVSDIKTPSGRRTIDCADDVAANLRGMEIDQVYATAALNLEVSEESLRAQYGHLNIGMQRMNLGNRIRGAEKSKEEAKRKMERARQREELVQLRAQERARAAADKERRVHERAMEREAQRAAKLAAKSAPVVAIA